MKLAQHAHRIVSDTISSVSTGIIGLALAKRAAGPVTEAQKKPAARTSLYHRQAENQCQDGIIFLGGPFVGVHQCRQDGMNYLFFELR
jgi:hypothetical protein